MTPREDNVAPLPPSSRARLNLLLSFRRGQDQPAMDQLPTLLGPFGIRTILVTTGEGAAAAVAAEPVHIAVVDLTVPIVEAPGAKAGGARVLQLLRRLAPPPPTVVVRPPQPTARESARGLLEALREGAFAVLDRPLHLETLLEVMRRILRRHYAGMWPDVGQHPRLRSHPDL